MKAACRKACQQPIRLSTFWVIEKVGVLDIGFVYDPRGAYYIEFGQRVEKRQSITGALVADYHLETAIRSTVFLRQLEEVCRLTIQSAPFPRDDGSLRAL